MRIEKKLRHGFTSIDIQASPLLRVRNLAKTSNRYKHNSLAEKVKYLTQNKLRRAREGCKVQWFAVCRRSLGAWSAWCRVGAVPHFADSSSGKVWAVCSALLFKGPHTHTDFQPGAHGSAVCREAGFLEEDASSCRTLIGVWAYWLFPPKATPPRCAELRSH